MIKSISRTCVINSQHSLFHLREVKINIALLNLCAVNSETKAILSSGGQTEVNSDQTIFERTHVLGALELHGLEKTSSALLSGQWSGTCLIKGHFVLERSDKRQFQAAH